MCTLLFLALGLSTAQAQQRPADTSGSPILSVQEGLSRAAAREIGPLESFAFLRRAAEEAEKQVSVQNSAPQDVATIATLKELALRYANDDELSKYREGVEYSGVPHTAMYALQKKGVPRSYFFELARQYKQDKWPAFYAATILASHPDEETMVLLEQMIGYFDDAYIYGAYQKARFVQAHFEDYEQMTLPEEKASFLIGWSGRGFQGLSGGAAWSESSHLDPMSVRAREELLSFSRQHPEVAARALAEVELRYGSVHSYQRHMLPYLAENARRAFERMTAN